MDLPLKNKKIKNLFVVDWKNTSSQEIDNLLNKAKLEGYEWSFYNCHAKNYAGSGVVNRYISYFLGVVHIIKNKKNTTILLFGKQ